MKELREQIFKNKEEALVELNKPNITVVTVQYIESENIIVAWYYYEAV